MSDPSAEPGPLRTAFFVDGFNLYHSLLAAGRMLPGVQLKWLDLPALLDATLPLIDRWARLASIHYFTAYANHLQATDPGKIQRHQAYVRALTARKIVIHLGKFQPRTIWCRPRPNGSGRLLLARARCAVVMAGPSQRVGPSFADKYPGRHPAPRYNVISRPDLSPNLSLGRNSGACGWSGGTYVPAMSFAEVLQQLPAFTLAQRQMLVRQALELDDPGLSPGDAMLVEERLAAHRADPSSAVPADEMKRRLRTRFPA